MWPTGSVKYIIVTCDSCCCSWSHTTNDKVQKNAIMTSSEDVTWPTTSSLRGRWRRVDISLLLWLCVERLINYTPLSKCIHRIKSPLVYCHNCMALYQANAPNLGHLQFSTKNADRWEILEKSSNCSGSFTYLMVFQLAWTKYKKKHEISVHQNGCYASFA